MKTLQIVSSNWQVLGNVRRTVFEASTKAPERLKAHQVSQVLVTVEMNLLVFRLFLRLQQAALQFISIYCLYNPLQYP